ncbi:MAG: isopenicillin-N epimerase [Planctomycetota bacterium]|nr:MAG: isopenicillin-N epimerase [Planctomycetota bacterium]
MNTADSRTHWDLDPEIVFLNHGSFGACPRVVLDAQQEWRARMERNPVQFFQRDLEPALDVARAALAPVIGAPAHEIAFVPNATTGVNAVLASFPFEAGDELLITNHGYNACNNAARQFAEARGAKVVVAQLPFPAPSEDALLEGLRAAVSERTRLALVDHITSETALRLPVERFAAWLAERAEDTGRTVELLVDGAHAPGQLPLSLAESGATFVTGNAHKWLCAPKGAAYLWVRPDWHERIRPRVVSHYANSSRRDRSGFLESFDWTGTHDPTNVLAIPASIEFLSSLYPGGLDEHMRRNHELALAMRDVLCEALQIEAPAPDELLGCMAALPLPPDPKPEPSGALQLNGLQERLSEHARVEVPVMGWPTSPARMIRVSAQAYNTLDDARTLADALTTLLAEERA